MKQLLPQIKWQILIFSRNNLVAMIIGITAFYMIAIYFLKDLGDIEKLLTLLILSDPSLIGFVFIGFSVILEKDQEVLIALFTTPINLHHYLISRLLTLAFFCLFCALGMVFTARGIDFNIIHFSFGALSTCIIFSLFGILVVSYTKDILHYFLRSIPLLVFMSFPLFNYFELTNISILNIFPINGSLLLISNSYVSQPVIKELIAGYSLVTFWIILLYICVYQIFNSKVVKS
jgi:fluoroquinolone transport system permease protein